MPDAPANTKWFTYFPKDYRWSAAICGMIGGARWGATEIGEVDQVGRRLARDILGLNPAQLARGDPGGGQDRQAGSDEEGTPHARFL